MAFAKDTEQRIIFFLLHDLINYCIINKKNRHCTVLLLIVEKLLIMLTIKNLWYTLVCIGIRGKMLSIVKSMHSPWPVDVMELFARFCCWTLILVSRHWAWLRRGYWRYRSLTDWFLIFLCEVFCYGANRFDARVWLHIRGTSRLEPKSISICHVH